MALPYLNNDELLDAVEWIKSASDIFPVTSPWLSFISAAKDLINDSKFLLFPKQFELKSKYPRKLKKKLFGTRSMRRKLWNV